MQNFNTLELNRLGWSLPLASFGLAPDRKLFPCSTQLSTKFILLINVKMPTKVGILTFISMINATSERLKAINFLFCQYFSFYEQIEILCAV